jgi:hypothetical protein
MLSPPARNFASCAPPRQTTRFLVPRMTPSRGRSTRPCDMKWGVMLSLRAKHLVGRRRMQRSDERIRIAQHDTFMRSRY